MIDGGRVFISDQSCRLRRVPNGVCSRSREGFDISVIAGKACGRPDRLVKYVLRVVNDHPRVDVEWSIVYHGNNPRDRSSGVMSGIGADVGQDKHRKRRVPWAG